MVNGSNPCNLLKMKKRFPAETMEKFSLLKHLWQSQNSSKQMPADRKSRQQVSFRSSESRCTKLREVSTSKTKFENFGPFQLVQSFPFSFPPFINCVWSDLFLFLGRYFRFRKATKIFRSLQTTMVSQRAVSIGALLAPCWSASFVPTRRYLQFPGLPGSKTLCKLTLTI